MNNAPHFFKTFSESTPALLNANIISSTSCDVASVKILPAFASSSLLLNLFLSNTFFIFCREFALLFAIKPASFSLTFLISIISSSFKNCKIFLASSRSTFTPYNPSSTLDISSSLKSYSLSSFTKLILFFPLISYLQTTLVNYYITLF